MAKIKSKLKETNFSNFNLRDAYITSYPEYAAALRDEALFSNYGIKATVKIPKVENNVDEYSNFVDDDFEIFTESVIPNFEQYRQNVSENGMAADGTQGLYPLEVIIPTKLHLPKNSRLVLKEYDSNEHVIAREWTVLSTEMKQLSNSKTYTRIANCVPSRQSIHHTSEFDEEYGIFYFDINEIIDKFITTDLRVVGCMYFEIHSTHIDKHLAVDIMEVIDMPKEYQEVVSNQEGTDPELQEDHTSGPDPDYMNIKSLHTDKTVVSATFVIKPTAISVLY